MHTVEKPFRKVLMPSLAVCVLLIAVWATFSAAVHNGFVNWDDGKNFLENPHFRGLGWAQIRWALTTAWLGVYQPLGWLIFEAQYSFWALSPKAYHLISLAFHGGNTVLLYFCLRRISRLCGWHAEGAAEAGALFSSLFFALHPLRTEVVAWASCQPYLPACFFSLLSVHCFLSSREEHRGVWWFGSVIFFALALLSKIAVVGLALVLWALNLYLPQTFGCRLRTRYFFPHAVLAAGAVFLAVLARNSTDDPTALDAFAWSSRLAQSAFGAHFPILKMLDPSSLSPFYPLPRRFHFYEWPFLGWFCSGLLFCAFLSVRWRKWPGLTVGLFCYLLLLLPTLGLLRYAEFLTADRYSYIPSLVLMAGVAFLFQRAWNATAHRKISWARPGIVVLAGALLFQLAQLTRAQASIWRDSLSLWSHALKHGSAGAPEAHNNFAIALQEKGELGPALREFDEALRLNPEYVEAYLNRGITLAKMGKLGDAEQSFERAISLAPLYSNAFSNLGFVYLEQGKTQAAKYALEEAIRLDPTSANPRNNLGVAYSKRPANRAKSIELFRAALRWDPLHQAAKNNLAMALEEDGQYQEAERLLREVLQSQPDHLGAAQHLKSLLARRSSAVK